MSNKSKTLVTLLILSLLLAFVLPTRADQSEGAQGLWQYIPTLTDVRVANGNTFLYTTEVGQWFGTFEGTSTEDGKVVLHTSGFMSFKGEVSFIGTVDGRSGTLKMVAVGKKPDQFPETEWEGNWVILGGTGELENLHGQGTWWGPGWNPAEPDEWGDIYYEGDVHFDP